MSNSQTQISTAPKLDAFQQIYVLECLANFMTAKEIQEKLKESYDITLTERGVQYYQYNHTKKIAKLRSELEKTIKEHVPIANKFIRMKELQKQIDKLKKQELSAHMLTAFTNLLREARTEMEGFKASIGVHPDLPDFSKYAEKDYDRAIEDLQTKEESVQKVAEYEVVQ